jgi:hypothetical protein
MATATLPRTAQPATPNSTSIAPWLGALLAAWLVLVLILGAQGAFVGPPGAPPLAIFLAVAAPIALFAIGYRASPRFRDFVLGLDIQLATAVQAWRFAGFGFIALQTYHVLPGVFTWPAGLGDMAIGLSAPFVALALNRNPRVAASRRFVIWNLLGLLDFVVAVSIGTLVASQVIGVADGTTTVPMSLLPLLLIPAFLVPCFAMLHITALIQARRHANAVDSL